MLGRGVFSRQVCSVLEEMGAGVAAEPGEIPLGDPDPTQYVTATLWLANRDMD